MQTTVNEIIKEKLSTLTEKEFDRIQQLLNKIGGTEAQIKILREEAARRKVSRLN